MKIQVLVSTMNQVNHAIVERLNLQSDAVIVNQCDKNSRERFTHNGFSILWINSTDRGLSKSRNMAISNSTSDICLLCDDDETLNDGYADTILKAFYENSNAMVLIFNVNRVGWNEKETLFTEVKEIPWYKTYSSVHVAFRRNSILNNNIEFNIKFGAGSGMYACAEDAIFCMDCHKCHLKMHTYPAIIASVHCEQSSWFVGYNEKYFYDAGAYLAVAFPMLKHFVKWYYIYRFRKLNSIGNKEIIHYINLGIKGFKKNQNYIDYLRNSVNK